ncbi:MAG TPA: hypothetical protein DEQ86_00690 [Candidatus Jacksonbacteria bacterium]|nr:hypothetical protein [Candidatus Jacksonbacteria bacterium]
MPQPTVTLEGVPTKALLGGQFDYTLKIANNDPGPGISHCFAPFIDLVFPVTGKDGTDGISFVSATYNGGLFNAVTLPCGRGQSMSYSICQIDALGCTFHPYASITSLDLKCGYPPNQNLVILRLPFTSIVSTEPAIALGVKGLVSNLADAKPNNSNPELELKSRGGCQFGSNSAYNPVTDPAIMGNWATATVEPVPLILSKIFTGNQTIPSGTNFSGDYIVNADIGAGQIINNFEFLDTLPDNMEYLSFVSYSYTPPYSSITEPLTGGAQNPPNNVLDVRWAALTGTAAPIDAQIKFSVQIPRIDANGSQIISPTTGACRDLVNTAKIDGTWDPVDPGDAVMDFNPLPANSHTLKVCSLTTKKSVAIVNDAAPAGYSPDDVLEYTLQFNISDYFGFRNLILNDKFSDGQLWRAAFNPTLTVTEDGSSSGNFNVANYTVTRATGTTGETSVSFNISNELITRGFDALGEIFGGCLQNAVGPANCGTHNHGPTIGTLKFQTTILKKYTDKPTVNENLDQGDRIWHEFNLVGQLVSSANNWNPYTTIEPRENLDMVSGQVTSKSVYAFNGSTIVPGNLVVSPENTLTYRIKYLNPSSDLDSLRITDFIPAPIFAATSVTQFDATFPPNGSVPPAGWAKFGPSDTFRALSGIVPTLVADGAKNTLTFDFGTYAATSTTTFIDLLFTMEVKNAPFMDNFKFANPVFGEQDTSRDELLTTTKVDITPILGLPSPVITKGVIAVSSGTQAYFVPASPTPSLVTPPGDTTCPRFSGIISTGSMATASMTSDIFDVDAGDLLTFSVLVQNAGQASAGAFDVKFQDAIPPYLSMPAGGYNFCLTDGTGAEIVGATLTSATTAFTVALPDPGPTPNPSGGLDPLNLGSGRNLAILTYDLQVNDTGGLAQAFSNTASLTNFSSVEGGPNYVQAPPDPPPFDWAWVTVLAPNPQMTIATTSEAHTTVDGTGTPALAVGEIVRMRYVTRLSEGVTPQLRFQDLISPDNNNNGLLFLNDGTAKVGFVSNQAPGNVTSTLIPAGCADLVGDETTEPGLIPGCSLPDDAVSESDVYTTDDDSYTRGSPVNFRFGDVTNNDRDVNYEYVIVEGNFLVLNSYYNYYNDVRRDLWNRFNVYRSGTTLIGTTPPLPGWLVMHVVEPVGSLSNVFVTAPSDGADPVIYRLRFINNNNAYGANAFDIRVADTLPATLTGATGTVTIFKPGYVTIVNSSDIANNIVDVRADYLMPGASITVDISAKVKTDVESGRLITNSANATWSGLPGASGTVVNPTGSVTPGLGGAMPQNSGWPDLSGERLYSFAAPRSVEIKRPYNDKKPPSPTKYTIGEDVTYYIVGDLAEGQTKSLYFIDNLPAGLGYLSHQIITATPDSNFLLMKNFNGVLDTTPTLEAPSPPFPGGNGTDMWLNFGDTTTVADNDPDNNKFVIKMTARVLNVLSNHNGVQPINSTTIRYWDPDTASTTNGTSGSAETIQIEEPRLALDKFIVTPPSPPDVGGKVTYAVKIYHHANSKRPAYDVVFNDPMPVELVNVNVTDVITTGGLPVPTWEVATGGASVMIRVPNSTDGTFDLPLGSTSTVTVVFEGVIGPLFIPGQKVINTARVFWNSLKTTHPNWSYRRTSGDGLFSTGTVAPAPLNDYEWEKSVPFQYVACSKKFLGVAQMGYCTTTDHFCNLRPVAGIVLTQKGNITTTPFGFTGNNSIDDCTDTCPMPAGLDARWTFAYNPVTPTWDINELFLDNIQADHAATHQYSAFGSYTVGLQVRDKYGYDSVVATKNIGIASSTAGLLNISPVAYPATNLDYRYDYGVILKDQTKDIEVTICNLGAESLAVTGWTFGGTNPANFGVVAPAPTTPFTLLSDSSHPSVCSSQNSLGSYAKIILRFSPLNNFGTYVATFDLASTVGNLTIDLQGAGRDTPTISSDTTPVEKIIYDGRMLINPPPGFMEFLESLRFLEPAKPK